MPQATGGSMESMRTSQSLQDEVATLREANIALKRSNLSKEEEVRRYAVKMERIKHGLAAQAVGKESIPAHRARANKEFSKDDRIAELELALGQRDVKEQKLEQQVQLLKLGVTGSGGRATKRLVRPASAPRAGAGGRPASAGARPKRAAPPARPASGVGAVPPMSLVHAAAGGGASPPPPSAAAAAAAAAVERAMATASPAAAGGGAADMSAYFEILREKERALGEKDRVLHELQNKLAVAEDVSGAHDAVSSSGVARSQAESAELVELRRKLKDHRAQLTLLTQKYDHQSSRFAAVRENHEKVLAQMGDLNRIIREVRPRIPARPAPLRLRPLPLPPTSAPPPAAGARREHAAQVGSAALAVRDRRAPRPRHAH
jgi:hypothetical protein